MEGGEDLGKHKKLKNKRRSSDEDVKKHKRKKKIYTSSSSGSSDESCRRKKKSKHKRSDGVEEKHKRKNRHKKEKKMKKKLKDKKKSKRSKETSDDEGAVDIPLGLMSTSMAPMTKEEWDKQQSVVRKVYDESTGRHRLIKGDGEVIEEIVSRERHKAINQEATRGDGNYFQANLQKKINR